MIFPRHFFKTVLFSLTTVIFFGVLSGCSEKPQYPWYETISMYHVFVKSFFDSNGDGKGDLKGLTQKLDYVRSLNVNTIYMLPITPALNVPEMPRSHYGYEITDFKNIHPDYGTMEDFKTLTKEAHKRGLHIVLDFITTVISVEHPFFQDILNNPDSKYKDWIITSPVIPEGEWMNFNDYKEQFESSAWKPLPYGGYYYSLWGNSPFLNYHNPEVQEYILSVVDFWLDAGADGFRVDATKHLFINGPGQEKQYHQPENFEFWKKLRRHIQEKYGSEKVLIAETVPIPNDVAYVVPGREMFDLMFDSTFINDVYPYRETNLDLLYSAPYLHSFFSNPAVYKLTPLKDRLIYHSDHDGARVATRIKDPTPEKLKTIASVLILTPAHIKLYAGDEIGIKGFSDFNDFKNKWFHATVASMAWDNSKNGGFTTSYTPVVPITDDYRDWNVKAQDKDEHSLLNHYRRLFELKNKYPQLFFKGRRFAVNTGNDNVYAYLLNNGSDTAVVIINLGKTAETFTADLSKYRAGKAELIFADHERISAALNDGVLQVKDLPPYSTFVFKFDTFDPALLQEGETSLAQLNVVVPEPGKTETSQAKTAFVFDIPDQGGLLRLLQGQGKVELNAYDVFGDGQLSETFRGTLDTTEKDVLLPVLQDKTDAVIFAAGGVRFSFETQDPQTAVPADLPKLASFAGNKNMTNFHAGKDENFWYFKMDRNGDALQNNGGLDFIIFINENKRPRVQQRMSFWRLPDVVSRMPVDAMILYERHIKTGKVQTDINAMRDMGISAAGRHFIFERPDAFLAMVSRDTFPEKSVLAAPFVWSAAGNWGDTPPTGKPLPVVERLPFDPQKRYIPYLIDEYLEVK